MRLVPWLLTLLLLVLPAAPAVAAIEEAVLAGGCFWCLEHDLETLPGVFEVESGYSGGKGARPTNRQVSAGGSGPQEVLLVGFVNSRIRDVSCAPTGGTWIPWMAAVSSATEAPATGP